MDDPAARPPNIIPVIPTDNPELTGPYGMSKLYNQSLDNLAYGVFQHGIVFGLAFAFRWFQPRKVLDLYYLALLFSFSGVAAPILFLWDRNPITTIKLNFFLEHEAIEYIIALKVVFAPQLVQKHPGRTLMASWLALFLATVAVALTNHYHHGADVVIWAAFCSDAALAAAGAKLVWNWLADGGEVVDHWSKADQLRVRLLRVEAMLGLALAMHGVSTMPVPVVYTLVIYNNLSPDWYSYSWFVVFGAVMPALALLVPALMVFFGRVQCCCGRPRGAFPEVDLARGIVNEGVPGADVNMATKISSSLAVSGNQKYRYQKGGRKLVTKRNPAGG
ncbi:hypothetical protein GTA08_BOTSDO05893 [Neofusicoccum parvum]|uniref:Uncharacterized protein n=1 Tax=Neofusicoccum parvum TaxID=310453 RepID=A0ACB5S6G8_9PEZI|nr:hypothetical protein GTA08_BOTSDO05893 [Neofusicoccum parvum]